MGLRDGKKRCFENGVKRQPTWTSGKEIGNSRGIWAIRSIVSIVKNQFCQLVWMLNFHKHVHSLKNVPKSIVERLYIITFKSLNPRFKAYAAKHI